MRIRANANDSGFRLFPRRALVRAALLLFALFGFVSSPASVRSINPANALTLPVSSARATRVGNSTGGRRVAGGSGRQAPGPSFDAPASVATWTPVTTPSFNADTALLLTDGTVMVHEYCSANWHRLTPDSFGNYTTGTWDTVPIAPIPSSYGYGPLYFSSAVLADGRVVILGGEFNDPDSCQTAADTNLGAIYDPTTNTWSQVSPPSGWTSIGDAQNVVLPNGNLLLANIDSTQIAELNPSTLQWTTLNPSGKDDGNSEEGWVVLPDGSLLTVDTEKNDSQGHTLSQRYLPSTNAWTSAGSTGASLTTADGQNIVPEIGPGVLRPNNTVVWFGSTGQNAVYNVSSGTWSVGPTFPVSGSKQLAVADGPAALLPSGNVLVGASPFFTSPTNFYEFDGSNLNPTVAPAYAPYEPTYNTRMLVLPTGQVLWTSGSTDVEIYTSVGSANASWAPTIATAPSSVQQGQSYSISGTQFNGLSQAMGYGDDAQAATNYPLVRIQNNATGHVFYCRTHGHSTMGVATGSASVSTNFDVPSSVETGASTLEVVANGIASSSWSLTVTSQGSSPSVTAFVSPPTTSTYGQFVTFTTSVTVNGAAVTAGTITLKDTTGGTTLFSNAALNSSGEATFSFASLGAGNHTIQASYSGATGISSSSSSTAITVAKATLTVTANSQTITYPASPTFTATITGFVNGDTSAVVGGTASFSYSATFTNGQTNAGSWTIMPSAGTLSATNYTFGTGTAYASGTLTVNKASLTVTANNLSTVANITLPVLTATITGLVNSDTFSDSSNTFPVVNNGNALSGAVTGTLSLATTATSSSLPGSYPINAGPGGLSLSAANYAISFVAGSLTVTNTAPLFSAIALNFGSQGTGTSSATQTVTVTNAGSSSLSVTNVGVTGDFSQTNNCTTVVASGNCAIVAKFTPTATGPRRGALTVTDNGSNNPQVIHLSGFGAGSAATAIVSLSTIDLNFGGQALNTTSAAKTVTLTNSGGRTLTVSSVTTNSNFAQTNNCGAVAVSGTCTISATFTPTATGTRTGSVVILDNATGSPQVIRLLGAGTSAAAPAIGFSKVSLNFGSQTTGTTSSAQTITVTNTGNATLTISGATTTGDFAASGCVTSLAAGASCTLSVTFKPSVSGARRGTVAFADSVTGSPQVIQLFGHGT